MAAKSKRDPWEPLDELNATSWEIQKARMRAREQGSIAALTEQLDAINPERARIVHDELGGFLDRRAMPEGFEGVRE